MGTLHHLWQPWDIGSTNLNVVVHLFLMRSGQAARQTWLLRKSLERSTTWFSLIAELKREVAEALGVSYGTAINILHDKLSVRKVSARWVPRLLTVDNKRIRLSMSKQCLDLFKRNSQEFLRRVVTVDGTWIHYYTPETNRQSKQWIFSGESGPKKAKTVPSAGKVMATNFWDSKGIILMDFLQKGRTITGQY